MTSSNTKIRRSSVADAEMLAQLAYETFYDAFHAHPKNAPEDLAAYMDQAFSLETIRKELGAENSIFLIADNGDETAGYARILMGSFEDGISAERPIEVNRLYALQKFLGQGIGQSLMDECFRVARENGCDAMWLGVWEHNPRAINFYRKCGFRVVGKHNFRLGSDLQTDLLMQKTVSEDFTG